jgi:hypothetical protein
MPDDRDDDDDATRHVRLELEIFALCHSFFIFKIWNLAYSGISMQNLLSLRPYQTRSLISRDITRIHVAHA